MKKSIVAIIAVCAIQTVSAVNINYDLDLSIGLKGGYVPSASAVSILNSNFTSNSIKDGAAIGMNIGAEFHENFSSEIEVMHHFSRGISAIEDQLKSQTSVSYTTGMVNGYIKFPTQAITWYLGGGVGINYIRVRPFVDAINNAVMFKSNDQYKFAWQLMTGISIPYSKTLEFETEFRYLNAGRSKTAAGSATDAQEIEANEFLVLAGVKHYF